MGLEDFNRKLVGGFTEQFALPRPTSPEGGSVFVGRGARVESSAADLQHALSSEFLDLMATNTRSEPSSGEAKTPNASGSTDYNTSTAKGETRAFTLSEVPSQTVFTSAAESGHQRKVRTTRAMRLGVEGLGAAAESNVTEKTRDLEQAIGLADMIHDRSVYLHSQPRKVK